MEQPLALSAATDAPARREFVDAATAAALLGVKKSRVYELARLGRLPVIRQGRSVRFSRPGLDALHEQATAVALDATTVRALDDAHVIDRLTQAVEAAAARGVARGLREALMGLRSDAA